MFGHLKAEDFTNLLEGAPLNRRRLSHLQSCARCQEKFESVQAIRQQMTEMDAQAEGFIPEPDWSEFRSGVRNALLSRSVKREYTRHWLGGLPARPVLAWGIAAVVVVGVTITSGLLPERRFTEPAPPTIVLMDPAAEDVTIDALASLAGGSQMDVLDDVLQLNPAEAENLEMILEDLTQRTVSSQ
jgi:hypothetical protein